MTSMKTSSRVGTRDRWLERLRQRGRKPLFPSAAVPWAVLAGALVFTTATALFLAQTARERAEERFRRAVLSTEDLIDRRLHLYVVTLRGVAGLFSVLDTVTVEDFHRYVDRLRIQEHYPGIQGIGWTERLSARPLGRGEFHEVHAIRYLEPMDARNRAAIGYDMYSEPTRRLAMARARDGGGPAFSGRVRLVQEIVGQEQAGFLLYLPVYRDGQALATEAERRDQLMGFVYSPFRADDLFAGIFGSETQPRVRFLVYDGTEPDPDHLLYASPGDPLHRPMFRSTRAMVQSGAPWTVVFESTRTFDIASPPTVPVLILLLGLAASLWLFFLARGQARARTAAEYANQSKSTFLATMSHELRTPLNAIAGYADLLNLEVAGPLTPKQRQYLERIGQAQKHLLGLIDDVLHFAKVEAGRIVVEVQPTDIERAVASADAMMATHFSGRRIEYARQGGPALKVQADPEKLRQILINLLSNALKFTDPGGTVLTRWGHNGTTAFIDVADTGVGIPADKLSAIFEPFVQADADLTRTRHGTGLGLAISRQLARAMGGDIVVRSEPGVGSTFSVTLQRAEDA